MDRLPSRSYILPASLFRWIAVKELKLICQNKGILHIGFGVYRLSYQNMGIQQMLERAYSTLAYFQFFRSNPVQGDPKNMFFPSPNLGLNIPQPPHIQDVSPDI